MKKSWHIPRRSFLRGAGASLGLPLLDAMGELLPTASPSASSGVNTAGSLQAPVRLACLYFPNGVWRPAWFPEKSGADYQPTPSLQPLTRHRDNLLVFSGLDKKHSHGGDGITPKPQTSSPGCSSKKPPVKTSASAAPASTRSAPPRSAP